MKAQTSQRASQRQLPPGLEHVTVVTSSSVIMEIVLAEAIDVTGTMIVETIVTKKTVITLVVMVRIMKRRSRPVGCEINSSVTVETASISDTDVTGTETAEMPVMRMIVMEPVPAVSSTAITAIVSMVTTGVTVITTAET